jgi:hypothetical protein
MLLAVDWMLVRLRRPATFRPLRDVLLALLAVGAVLGYHNFGRFHYGAFVQHADFLQLYVGAKYFPELGYDRLYACFAAADAQEGRIQSASRRWFRDLVTNEATLGHAALVDPRLCTARFSRARWETFKHDLAWFRARMPDEKWEAMLMSHGYNGTPVATSLIATLAPNGPVSTARVHVLAMIDPALMLLTAVLVGRVFGWRVLAVAVIWWGTNQPAGWTWHGGSLLRALHLSALTAAICLASRERFAWGGGFLALATALRVFPVLALLGPLAQWLTRTRRRGPQPFLATRNLLAGFGVGVLVLVGLTATQDTTAWRSFVEDTWTFAGTPLTNSIGLAPVLAFEPATRAARIQEFWERYPWDTWKAARIRTLLGRRWLLWLGVAAAAGILSWAVRRQPAWVALVLGTGMVPIVTSIPGYYYSYLLVFAFLWPRYPVAGIGLLGLSTASNLGLWLFDARDELYLMFSIATMVYIGLVWTAAGTNRPSTPVAPSPRR